MEKERTSITIDKDVMERGQEKAKEERRSFSNYVELLIHNDTKDKIKKDKK